MRKDKLYTVNKWNKPAFMGDRTHQNIFLPGGPLAGLSPQQMANLKAFNLSANMTPTLSSGAGLSSLGNVGGVASLSETDPTKFFGLDAAGAATGTGGFNLGNIGQGLGLATSLGGAAMGIKNGNFAQTSSAIGAGLSSVNPALGAIWTGASTAIGLADSLLNEEDYVANQQAIDANKQQTQLITNNASTMRNANDYGTIFNTMQNADFGSNVSASDISLAGEDSAEAARQARILNNNRNNAIRNFQSSLVGGLNRVNTAQVNVGKKQYINAFGGRLFADGGLKAAFFDEFGSDPIGAAVRYNQGLERQAAEEEEAAMNAAREAEYLANQQRLANLETQYQGLQALMSAMPTNTSSYSEEPASSSSPSRAAYNSNWDYIEDQLRKSGKFNDVQIQGIKYNLQRESGIGKYDNGDNGTARGLAQWRGDRIPKDMSLEGQTRHLIDTLSNYDGKLHWIGEDNYRGFMNARTPEEAHYYIARGYERPHRDIIAKVKRDSDMSLRNLKALGGDIETHGSDFTNGLMEINEGGTHEENPLDGVPLGLDDEFIPNLVEEGETVYNDYVFSDRMKVPTFMYKELGLGGVIKKKGKGMSFADASKKLSQESEQRPNDPISKAGLDAALSRLAEVQETERMKQNAEEYMGLAEYACGGKLGNRYDYGGALKWLREKHPEMGNKEQIAKAMAAHEKKYPSKAIDSIRYSNIFGNITKGSGNFRNPSQFRNTTDVDTGKKHYQELLNLGMDKRVAFGLAFPQVRKEVDTSSPSGYNVQRYNEYTKARDTLYNELVRGKKSNAASTEKPAKPQKAVNQTEAQTPTATTTSVAAGTMKERSQEAAPKVTVTSTPTATGTKASNRGQAVPGGSSYKKWDGVHAEEENTPEQIARMEAARREGMPALGPGISLTEVAERTTPTENEGLPVEATMPEQGIMVTNPNTSKKDPYPTWMRYAPVLGNGLMTLTDVLGITNKPDYTYADKIEGYARQAGNAPHVSYKPNGNYLRYDPMDIWFEQNRMDANARATDRAIMNNAAPIGTKMAGLLASGYNNQIANGQLYRSALEYNDAQRKDVAGFNRTTDMFNSQMGLEAAMANARYNQAAKQMGLSGLAQAASMRDAIDQRVGAARSANLTNFLTSLGNIGRENFAMNQINDDAAYNYGVRANGTTPFKRSGACGGKIKRRK